MFSAGFQVTENAIVCSSQTVAFVHQLPHPTRERADNRYSPGVLLLCKVPLFLLACLPFSDLDKDNEAMKITQRKQIYMKSFSKVEE